MNKKGLKINTESNKWNQPNLVKRIKEDFVKFIPYSNQRKEMIKNAEQIDWGWIVQFCTTEIDDIMKKLEIPENEDLSGWFSSFIELMILEFMNKRLYSLFVLDLNKLREGDTKARNEKIIHNMLKGAESEVKTNGELIKILLDIGGLKWIKDSDTMPIEIEKLKKYAEIGKKFSQGKQSRSYEIPSFKNIKRKYNQSKKEGIKLSYKSIAFYIARTEQNLFQDREQQNFYGRFLWWLKNNK